MRVAVVGATGLIGRHLVARLRARGDEVLAVSRGGTSVDGATPVTWDPSEHPMPHDAIDGVDAVVNLAGVPLTAARWSAAKKVAIRESRMVATRAVAEACANGGPRILCNASAVGVYGPTDVPTDESAPSGDDFLASVCVGWERAALAAAASGVRVVVARSGIVLATDGGALPRLLRLARLGVLGAVGSGDQWVPWIHHADETGAILHCLDRPDLHGPVNLVAPEAVRQRDLAATLREAVHRPPALPAPGVLVRAAMGDAAALVLTGQLAVPAALDASGFAFAFPTLGAAVAELLAS